MLRWHSPSPSLVAEVGLRSQAGGLREISRGCSEARAQPPERKAIAPRPGGGAGNAAIDSGAPF
jgi:hypothetical protein